MEIFQRARDLAQAFREADQPVVWVNVTPKEGYTVPRREFKPEIRRTPNYANLVPELDVQPGDVRITKHGPNAFYDTPLDETLRALGVTQIVVVGIATSAGVETTARAGFERGYNVALAIDVMSDRDAGTHEYSVTKVFPRIGEVGTAADIVAMLARPSGS
jgi:nicotinamidase-related amidase